MARRRASAGNRRAARVDGGRRRRYGRARGGECASRRRRRLGGYRQQQLGQTHGAGTSTEGGDSPLAAVIKTLSGSDDNGLGLALPLVLAAIAACGLAYFVNRRRAGRAD